MKINKGDWIQWYDYTNGRFRYGQVMEVMKDETTPLDRYRAFTDNGSVDLNDIIEVRKFVEVKRMGGGSGGEGK